jgi:hypothetical protein
MTDESAQRDRAAEETRMLGSAALLGAVIGAGLGLLLSRAFEREPTMTDALRVARRKSGRAIKRRTSAVSEMGSDAAESARDVLGHFADQARGVFESALTREIRQLRRAARRQRRRVGL